MYDYFIARHGVFRGHMHVGGDARVRMISFACSRGGGGGLRYFFLHSRRLGVLFSLWMGEGGLVISFWRGGGVTVFVGGGGGGERV